MRFSFGAGFIVALCACGVGAGFASPASPLSQPPAPSPQPYLTTIGDSITYGIGASDRETTSYAALLARALGARWTNLGIQRETLIPEPNAIFTGVSGSGSAYRSNGGVLADEVPNIPLQTTIVTLYIGTNDLYYTAASMHPDLSNAAGIFSGVGPLWDSAFTSLIHAIRVRVPSAKIVVATVINVADKGNVARLNAGPWKSYRRGFTDLANHMNAAIYNAGVDVAAVHCDARLYDVANYMTPDDVHPNDIGHRALFEDFMTAIRHPQKRPSPCIYDGPI